MGKRFNRFNSETETVENQKKIGTSGEKKKFSIHDLIKYYPKTEAQTNFFRAYEDGVPVMFQVGPAGTGKTAVALWNMMNEYLSDPTKYDCILIIRPPVATVDLGFMPGDEDDKESYYEDPYREALDDMFKFNASYDNLKSTGVIKFKTSANLRGINCNRKLIIVDEFQSANLHSLKTMFTRLGHGSKICFCGDFGQNDLVGKKGAQESGFVPFMKIIDRVKSYGNYAVEVIEYGPKDVVRSGIVRDFVIACYELNM